MQSRVKEMFTKKKWKLALAESCTGGEMAAWLTKEAGASDYFLGSLVVYSNELKRKVLHVQEKTLLEKGAVSPEVVCEMLQGLFSLTSADFGLAVSGIAGPSGGSVEKPVGTVFAALGRRGKNPDVLELHIEGKRETVIKESAKQLLEALVRKVSVL